MIEEKNTNIDQEGSNNRVEEHGEGSATVVGEGDDEKPLRQEEEAGGKLTALFPVVKKVKKPKPGLGAHLALMYQGFVLDCISDLGYAVSVDFSQQPQLYGYIANDIAYKISLLEGSFGCLPLLPTKDTRLRLYKPIFGSWDTGSTTGDDSTYKNERLKLFEAAYSYAEKRSTI